MLLAGWLTLFDSSMDRTINDNKQLDALFEDMLSQRMNGGGNILNIPDSSEGFWGVVPDLEWEGTYRQL